jgi:hypothetical protein
MAQREALKRVAVRLKELGRPFALSGGYAAWARGAPEPVHDVDFDVAAEDAPDLFAGLQEAGLDVRQPPEDWLFKVFTDGAMVDVLHRRGGRPLTRADLDDAEVVEVLSVQMPVVSATDYLGAKLSSLDEHQCDLAKVLPPARALREQVEWARVRDCVRGNDFAEVSLELLTRLGIAPAPAAPGRAGAGEVADADRADPPPARTGVDQPLPD